MSPRAVPGITRAAADAALRELSVTAAVRLRAARESRGWTQVELAARAGVSRQVVHSVERGRRSSIGTIVAIALALRLEPALLFRDPRANRGSAPTADHVHAAMGEHEVARFRSMGLQVAVDEPYQRFRFSGRADIVAWRPDPPSLIHIENRTRFPDIQQAAGAWNAKCTWLGACLAERYGVRRWASETHVLACLWSAEVVETLRRHPETFRSLAPDPPTTFEAWWSGEIPAGGQARSLVLLDPRSRTSGVGHIGLEAALTDPGRPRYRGYADAAERLARG